MNNKIQLADSFAKETRIAVEKFGILLDEYKARRADLRMVEDAYAEAVRHVRQSPGAFLVTELGQVAWTRFRSTQKDSDTARGIAADLSKTLSECVELGNSYLFLDDGFRVVYDGEASGPLKPLSYAVLKALHENRPHPVTLEEIVRMLDDDELFRGRCRDKIPLFRADAAGEKRVSRAIGELPPLLRKLVKGPPRARYFESSESSCIA